jgi:hypothetical protein
MSAPSTATVLAGASLAMGAVSTGMSAIGSANTAQAQAAQMQYQAQVARNNQAVAQWNAQRALEQGEVDADNQNLKTAQLKGSQRAALAAEGGDVDYGSPLDIVADTARAGYTDAATIRSNAALQAYGYQLQAAGDAGTASADSASAVNGLANLPFGVGSSLLSGASSLGTKYVDWSRPGGPLASAPSSSPSYVSSVNNGGIMVTPQ